MDYEKRNEYNLVVKVSNKKPLVQGAKASNHDEANIKIKVLDVNEPPVLLEDSKNMQGFFCDWFRSVKVKPDKEMDSKFKSCFFFKWSYTWKKSPKKF